MVLVVKILQTKANLFAYPIFPCQLILGEAGKTVGNRRVLLSRGSRSVLKLARGIKGWDRLPAIYHRNCDLLFEVSCILEFPGTLR
jgi:hypothetical protein